MDVRRMDKLRRAAVAAVVEQHAPIILDIVFTTIEEFAVPRQDSTCLTETRSPREAPWRYTA
jgi:hypothetical protein